MKQKFTITIADVEMNVITDESAEAVEAIAGVLDRRIREIYLQSGSRCPKTEAALLCALDYCAERNMLQEQLTALEKTKPAVDDSAYREKIDALTKEKDAALGRAADAEAKAKAAEAKIAQLTAQLQSAKAAAEAAAVPAAPAEAAVSEEVKVEPVKDLAEEVSTPAEIAIKPLRTNVDTNQLSFDMEKKEPEAPAEAPAADLTDEKVMEKEKQKAQKRVRSMFDLINFDNV